MADVNTVFFCKFCDSQARSLRSHLHHAKLHRHLSRYFYCGLGHCQFQFVSESALRMHVIRNHKLFVSQAVRSIQANVLVTPLNQNVKYQCPVQSCEQQFFVRKSFMSHLKSHLESSTVIPCPFSLASGCKFAAQSWHSLTGHLSKKHKTRYSECIAQPSRSEAVESTDDVQDVQTVFSSGEIEEYHDCNETIIPDAGCDTVVTLAQFFQKLEYKHMVSGVATQLIFKELKTLLQDMQRSFLNSLSLVLKSEGLPTETVPRVMNSITCESAKIFDACNSLRSSYMRKQFYEKNFCFVEPQKVPLKNGSFFYYVPLAKTIQAAFKNKSWNFNLKDFQSSSNSGLYKDFYDGLAFKNNEFFKENPTALPIILYQDAFQLVCPIGPAKNLKHKVVGIYIAFGNLPPDVRFHKDSIQLVGLCREMDFDHHLVYGKIVEDLLELQTTGVNLSNFVNVKAGLAFICGDNLGSHQLGGMVASFSKATYFCRYCLLTRPLFNKQGGEVRRFPARTVDSYNKALEKAKVMPNGEIKSYQGIKFNSEFNKVIGYHTCAPGLPPCIGHDLCEGVIAHDLKLYIQYFVSKGWFTVLQLNDMLKNFPYSPEDTKDKPVVIKKLEKPKLAGGAWQLWITLRLFPLIIYGFVKDVNDPVWRNLLLLRDIAEFAVSPEIHESHLPWFDCAIFDYIVSRRELFSHVPIRPKHHYLLHFSEMVRFFGPLIKVWTLRFESKHTFFNRSWKSSNNSINFLKTLSFKHEFFQSWIRSGGGLRCITESGQRSPFLPCLYSTAVNDAVKLCNSRDLLEVCDHVTIMGTKYRKGDIVIMGVASSFSNVFNVGIIHLILMDCLEEVRFLVKNGSASFKYEVGTYKVQLQNSFQCVPYKDLQCYYPMASYVRDTETFLCLRHAVVNRPIQLN